MHGDWLDLVLVGLVVLAALSGYRQGFVVGVLSFVGLVGGAALGAEIAPSVARHFSGNSQAVAGVVVVFAVASLGRVAAGAVGVVVRRRLRWRPARIGDAVGGAVVSAVAVLLIAWFIASSLAQSPFPSVARAVTDSGVLTTVDRAMPGQVQSWFAQFRKVVIVGGFPQVFGALGAQRILPVAAPDPEVLAHPAVVAAGASVVKISGTAPSCQRDVQGTGFVFAAGPRSEKVMTNAHVVAGVLHPVITVPGYRGLRATVVYYDPRVDVAVLNVPGLHDQPLAFATAILPPGADVVVAGYPQDGPYTATSARIRGEQNARGPDIYDNANVTRQIYAVRGTVQPGNSGGPLLDDAGRVEGVVFAKAVNDDQTGYALISQQVADAASAGRSATTPVSTQGCD